MNDATRRVAHWIIGVRGEVPLVEDLATAEDVQGYVCGHVRWSEGTLGPAIELEDIDFPTVDWGFVLKAMHAALRIVEGNPVLQMGTGIHKHSPEQHRHAQCIVGYPEKRPLVAALGEPQQLFCQLMCRVVRRTSQIKSPQPRQNLEALRDVLHLLGQRSCPSVSAFDLWSCPTLDHHQRLSEQRLQGQLLLDPVQGLGQHREED